MNEGSKSNKPEYLYEKLSEIKVNVNSIVNIPAQRILASVFSEVFSMYKGTKFKIQNNLQDFINRYELAKAHNRICVLEPWDMVFKYENNCDVIYKNAHFFSKLSEMQPVIQSILPLKIVLEYYSKQSEKIQKSVIKDLKKLSFLVEEPEVHIPTDYYPYLVAILMDNCNVKTNNLIITTNSDRMLNSIVQKNNETMVFLFEKGEIKKM